MKKTLLTVCLAALFPAVVHAQSAVTLYGIIDEGLSYTSNAATANANGSVSGHSAVRLLSGVMQQSRWGMRGAEDLGGGMKTIFHLGHGSGRRTGKPGPGACLVWQQASGAMS